jgi:hypothetical protein
MIERLTRSGWRRTKITRSRRAGEPERRRRFLPALDQMEERALLSTLTVTSNADSGTGSLRAAIAVAASGDTIVFSRSLDGSSIVLTSGELAISQSVTIEGPGSAKLAVSGGGNSRVFDITNSGLSVTISGLTIEDGAAPDGAGILDQGGSLTMEGDLITENHALGVNPGDSAEGGGVFVTLDASGVTGTLVVGQSQFTINVAQGAAGVPNTNNPFPDLSNGGNGTGGAIAGDQGTTITVAGSTFDNNQALGGPGGNNAPGQVGAGGGGGGVGAAVFTDLNATLSVSTSRFQDNLALGGQGGEGGQSIPNDSDFPGSGGGAGGGAIFSSGWLFGPNTSVFLSVSGCTFSGNAAQGGNGNGNGQSQGNPGTITGQGGSVSGGAITTGGGTINISNIQFDSNQAIAGNGATDVQTGETGEGGFSDGGAIFASFNSVLNVSGSTFENNAALGGAGGIAGWGLGGAIEADSDSFFTYPVSLVFTVDHSTFTGNVAQGGSGAGVPDGPSSLDGGNGWGGAIFEGALFAATFQVTDTNVDGNQAIGGNGGNEAGPASPYSGFPYGTAGFGAGGGLMISPFAIVSGLVSGSTFRDDAALGGTGGSGAAGIVGGYGGAALGGGIENSSFGATLTVESTTFTGDQAVGGPGGAGGTGAAGSPGGWAFGGGIYFQETTTLEHVRVAQNSAIAGVGGAGGAGASGAAGGDAFGGGVSAASESTIESSTITGNMVSGGAGGIGGPGGAGGAGGTAYGGGVELEWIASIASAVISDNSATGGPGGDAGTGSNAGDGGAALGGGIAIDGGPFTTSVDSSSIQSNSAAGGNGGNSADGTAGNGGIAQGGGIGITGVSASTPNVLDVSGTKIMQNAVIGGAGGSSETGAGGNGGDGQGGGLYVDALSILSIENSTVTSNSADGGAGGTGTTTGAEGQGIGGGIYLAGNGSTASNTRIVNNVASTSNDDIYGSFD